MYKVSSGKPNKSNDDFNNADEDRSENSTRQVNEQHDLAFDEDLFDDGYDENAHVPNDQQSIPFHTNVSSIPFTQSLGSSSSLPINADYGKLPEFDGDTSMTSTTDGNDIPGVFEHDHFSAAAAGDSEGAFGHWSDADLKLYSTRLLNKIGGSYSAEEETLFRSRFALIQRVQSRRLVLLRKYRRRDISKEEVSSKSIIPYQIASYIDRYPRSFDEGEVQEAYDIVLRETKCLASRTFAEVNLIPLFSHSAYSYDELIVYL